MDELAGDGHGAERGGELRKVTDVPEVAGRFLPPGDAVADSPGAGPVTRESGPGDAPQGGVEALADGDDLCPAAPLVLARDVLSGAPPVDTERAVGRMPGRGQPESIARGLRAGPGLPGQFSLIEVSRLEDQVSGEP
ncbi:MAG TPA: hypothetical protein VIJ82_13755 [Streptosporangiaceae bacterium]